MCENIAYDRQDRLLSALADSFIEICKENELDPDRKEYLMSRFEDFLFTTSDFEEWRKLRDGESAHNVERVPLQDKNLR